MNNIGEQINLVLDNIAKKLGVAVEKLYPALRTQALIDGIINVVWCIITLVIIIYFTKSVYKMIKNPETTMEREYSYQTEPRITYWQYTKIVFCIILIIICVSMFSCDLQGAITALANPDWYIINKIFEQLK